MEKWFKDIIITKEEINKRVQEIGKMIDDRYCDEPIVLLGLLKGSFTFLSDLARNISNPNVQIEFMVVKSYMNGKSTNNINIVLDLKKDISGKNIIIVEDIIDTGRTLSEVMKLIKMRGSKKIEAVALCTKPSQRKILVNLDYPSFEIPNEIVVGYGLDYNEQFRHLSSVYSLTQEGLKEFEVEKNV